MRITIVNQFYRPDIAPTAHLAASLAEHRAAMGDRVTVVAGKGAYAAADANARAAAAKANPRVLRVWTPGLGKASIAKRLVDYGFFYLFAAFKLLTLPRQDVIVTLTTPPLISWCAMLHKLVHGRNTRLVLWNMDCYPDVAERAAVIKADGFIARRMHGRNRAVFKHMDHLVCLDEAMARLLCGHYARVHPDLPVTLVPNWEDASFFPAEKSYETWEGRAGLGLDGKFTVLYLGNMGYGHDFETALAAAGELKGEPVTFLFVGGGRHWQAVKDEAAERGLSNVVVHPYIPKEKTGNLMSGVDCALVTLRDDAIGIMSPSKIHSNLAMGLPLVYVGPRLSNVDEAIEKHGCGISLRHGESGKLAAFVRGMVRDRAALSRMRAAARAAFEGAYCDRATLPRLDAVIEGKAAEGVPAGRARDFASPMPAGRTGPALETAGAA